MANKHMFMIVGIVFATFGLMYYIMNPIKSTEANLLWIAYLAMAIANCLKDK